MANRSEKVLTLKSAKKIDEVRLLVVGMGGLGSVVVRDAVKFGFRSVTMIDHKNCTEADKFSQVLISPEDISENRAEASFKRAQTLNKQVEVYVETLRVSEIDEHLLKGRFDVVVATCWELEDILKLNSMCRNAGIKFFAANVFGLFAFIFSDLLDNHSYETDVRGMYSSYGGKPENIVIRKKSFVPFKSIINHTFKSLSAFECVDPWYFVMRGILKFGLSHGALPSKDVAEDFANFKKLVDFEVETSFKNMDVVPDSYIWKALEREVPVICLTVGHVLSNEIVKSVTLQEEPNDSLYLFDPNKMRGDIVRIRFS